MDKRNRKRMVNGQRSETTAHRRGDYFRTGEMLSPHAVKKTINKPYLVRLYYKEVRACVDCPARDIYFTYQIGYSICKRESKRIPNIMKIPKFCRLEIKK